MDGGFPIDHIRGSWFHTVVGLAPGIRLAGFPEIIMVVNKAGEPVLFFVQPRRGFAAN